MVPEDLAILEQLPPEAARKFEALLHRQARSDRAHREHSVPLDDACERVSARLASFSHGPGGGRKR